ncbi:TlpA family protein disulfide reductase [Thalassotalea sp. M1531]|uniref:TlpA family protein disulfide reductase n=1 Tax=Thalassotalea algicola TaxID=2716224 RepID=A0A7Y0LB64_9GAMM|nr:TlpA disulfide reductase family protein [Thalassotalea algicola]NMP30927.1 TlpA family protein disulfide reductase [Thalassotalea algicola]
MIAIKSKFPKSALIFLALLSLLNIKSVLADQYSPKQTNKIKAPSWQLKQQNGEVISWEMYKGKPVILHFWATWCPYCKKLQPKLVELAERYKTDNVSLIGISFNEDPGAMPQNVIDERGHNFVTAVNGEHIATSYGVVGTPTTFFINRHGDVIFKYTSSDINDPRLALAIKEMTK